MIKLRLKILVLNALLLLIFTACPPGDIPQIVGNFPVIEPDIPEWTQDSPRFNFTARVTRGNGQSIPDSLTVKLTFFRVVSGGLVPTISVVTATRSNADENRFVANVTNFAPFPNTQSIEFFWLVETTDGSGEVVKVAETNHQRFQIGCPTGPTPQLVADQNLILTQFGGLTTIAEIASAGYVPTHNFLTFRGMGVAFARPNVLLDSVNHTPQLGTPDLLLFSPSATTGQVDSVDLLADEPYSLIGWAYGAAVGQDSSNNTDARFTPGAPFTLSNRPQLGCMPHEAWFIHEAGWHLHDGGFDVDETPGSELVGPIGSIYHRRIWDLHLWLTTTGNLQVPRLTQFNEPTPNTPVPGFGATFPAGGFFIPTLQ